MSSKREREHERARYEKRVARQERAASVRRQRILAGVLLGAVVLAVTVVAIVVATNDEPAPAAAPEVTDPAPEVTNAANVPDPALAEDRTWTGAISLNSGDIGIALDGAAAPQAVANFVTLAEDGFFDGTSCHRLTTSGIYVLQCGDPTATGTGGPGYTWGPIENAPEDAVYPAGTIAMARTQNDGSSMGSQFFLVYQDSTIPPDEAGGYTVFGQITSGEDVVQAIADAGTASDGVAPVSDVIIEGVKIQ